MDFALDKEQLHLQKAVKEFTKGEFDKELAREMDTNFEYPEQIWKKAADLGFVGMHFPEEYSGASYGVLENALVAEEFCRADSTIGACLVLSALGSECILRFGTDAQKKEWLPRVAEGEILSAFAFTEPESGQDLTNLSTSAVLQNGNWVINGNKSFVTNGLRAGFFVVLAKTDPEAQGAGTGLSMILVESNRAGVNATSVGAKMGIRMLETANVNFENVSVPQENLIGKQDKGGDQAAKFLDECKIIVAAQALGMAQGAYDRALSYVKQREQFGKKLAQFQITQHKLADMVTKIELARLITYKAAWSFNQKKKDPKLPSMAKMYSARAAVEVADEAVQLLGGYGYMTEYDVERFYRDAKITDIYEGTKEVQKNLIATQILGKLK